MVAMNQGRGKFGDRRACDEITLLQYEISWRTFKPCVYIIQLI